MALVEEYRSTNVVHYPSNTSEAIKWHPPENPRYKLNLDGAVFSVQKAAGMGVLVSDSEGRVMVAMSRRFPAPLATLEIEAKTMEAATVFAWEMGFREVIFETDSLILYRSLLGTSDPPSSIETVISSILSFVQSFSFFSFSHVKRHGIRPAHILAQFANQIDDCQVWLEETPSLIESACPQDVPSSISD
ncbi:uncharacterized protein LOC112036432 [Quercus suber]|uniref:uncharacterized protein LOC112036432 n=1 Tax=Quercus suber TaxID=58331 RepID=UPI000CE1EC03|nr:uncharacterized protein LOC112036432 [Quercus suber]